jgi:DNA-binding response OmpR family regulator
VGACRFAYALRIPLGARLKILVVEDDPKIASFIGKGFKEAGFAVDQAANGDSALELVLALRYDAAVVDIMLPGLDGVSLVKALRKRGKKLPVIFLSAKRELGTRVAALEKGGDDYMVKPFAFAELLARVKALLRRSSAGPEKTRLREGDLSLDLLTRQATRAGKKIELQAKEFSLLEQFMRSPGAPLSKTSILEHVWDYHFDPQTNLVDVLVSRLRAKIDKGFDKKFIHTVRGVGYVLR